MLVTPLDIANGTTVLLSFLFFSSIFLCLKTLPPSMRSPHYRSLDYSSQVDWDSRILSNIHVLISVTGALSSIFINEDGAFSFSCEETDTLSINFSHSPIREFYLCVSIGYFLYDLLLMALIPEISSKMMVAHHLIIIPAFALGVHLEIATHYMMVFILNEVSTPFVNNNTLMAMCHTSPYAQDVRREKARKRSGMNHDSSDDDGRDLARKEAEKEKGREEAEMHWVYHNHNIKDPSDVPVSAARAVCSPRSLHSLHSLLGSLLYSPLYSMLLSLLSSLLCSFNSLLRWPQLHLLKQSVIYKVNAVAVLIFFTISRVIMNVLLVDHIWRQTLFAHWDRLYAMGACTCISAHFLCLLALAHTCVNLVWYGQVIAAVRRKLDRHAPSPAPDKCVTIGDGAGKLYHGCDN